nr:hypothetical protein [Acidobacteriota bacterium]
GVTFDRNTFRNTYTHWQWGDNGVMILGGGPTPASSVGRVLVSNNFFSSTPGWQGMAYIDAGNNGGPDPGVFQFANNTTIANLYRTDFGAITIQKHSNFVPQSMMVRNNIFGGLGGGQQNIHADYAPAVWDSDSNVFDPAGVFFWNGTQQNSLAAWRQATGHDGSAAQCRPSFVNQGGGDFHLASSDACAKGLGSLLGGLFTWDIDGSPRPLTGSWDSGAHEARTSTVPPTAVRFYTVTPCRVLDTRGTGNPLNNNGPSRFPVAGSCGIPWNATAVSFNVTGVNSTAAVDLQVYPGDQPAPGTNVVGLAASQTRAASAVIALATDGSGTVGVLPDFQTVGQVDLVLDVNGYFAP